METKYFSAAAGDDVFEKCGDIIRSGGLVAFPTETVYGLGANAFSSSSARKVYKAKGRPGDNPLIVHIAFPEDAEKIAYTSDTYYKLAERFMPGPLTVILPKKDIIPSEVTGGLDSVGVRCPSDIAAHKLIMAAGVPIAAPSANRSGAPSPTKAEHVVKDMDGRIDAAILSDECDFGLESTVIKLDGDSALILRPGAVTIEDLKEVLTKVDISPAVTDPSAAGDKPASPGMKYKHYSPICDFILVDAAPEKFAEFVNSAEGKSAVICSEEEKEAFKAAKKLVYGKDGDYKALCFSLFAFFRNADAYGAEKLYARVPDTVGYGLALYNRMIRAADCKIIKL